MGLFHSFRGARGDFHGGDCHGFSKRDMSDTILMLLSKSPFS